MQCINCVCMYYSWNRRIELVHELCCLPECAHNNIDKDIKCLVLVTDRLYSGGVLMMR